MEVTVPLFAGEIGVIGEATLIMPKGKLKAIKLYSTHSSMRRLLEECDYEYDPLPEPHVNMIPVEAKPGQQSPDEGS